jgi:cysteine desulfurase
VNQPIYLDFAAASPLDESVAAAMKPYLTDKFYNPSAIYLKSKHVRDDLEAARRSVAMIIGVRPAEVIFTAGGTEANNLAIRGVMDNFPGCQVLVSSAEHESVIEAAKPYPFKLLPVDRSGRVDPAKVAGLIDEKTVLISIIMANNEIGTIQPLAQLAASIREVKQLRRSSGNQLPLYLHTDATQAANYLDLHVDKLGVDLMTLNGGKIYGPKQSGILFVSKNAKLAPLIRGGGQERGLRSGTENVAGDIGFAAALSLAQAARKDESLRLSQLQAQFFKFVSEQIPLAVINGSQKNRLPNNVHLTFPGQDNERLLFELDRAGVMAAAGSACNASAAKPSHVLAAIGLSDEQARSSIRFTMGRSTTSPQISRVVALLAGLVK